MNKQTIEFTHKETRTFIIDLDQFCEWLKENGPGICLDNLYDDNIMSGILSVYTKFSLPIDEIRDIVNELFNNRDSNIDYIKEKLNLV